MYIIVPEARSTYRHVRSSKDPETFWILSATMSQLGRSLLKLGQTSPQIRTDWELGQHPLSAGASLPATSLIFVCFFPRDSTQKSPQKIGARYNAPLSSP